MGLKKKASKQPTIPLRYSLLREILSTENQIVESLLSAKSICCVLASLTS